MLSTVDLWLPILLSAVFVFIVSSIVHMVLPYHRADCRKLPGEEEILAAMRSKGLERGEYLFPYPPSMKEMGSPEMLEKLNAGPVGFLTVLPKGPMKMGRSLLFWFLLCIALGIVVAYLASMALARDAAPIDVFRFTFSAAFISYATGALQNGIWKGVTGSATAKFLFDSLLYAATTGGTFVAFWPGT